ncbi:hypothetical protein COLU111180_13655 [Cohnella lubricantis]|nr:hypothetical protein [Cohnella lubricantis]
MSKGYLLDTNIAHSLSRDDYWWNNWCGNFRFDWLDSQ